MDDNKRFWDRFAKLYAPIQQRSNSKLYEAVVEACRPYLKPDQKVLELACGSGQLTLPLCTCVSSWDATDFSEKMAAEAQHRCPPQVRVSVQDATALPYEDGAYDVVLIANALHIMPDPRRALTEIRRVLKKDGVLLAPTFVYEGKVNRFRMWITERVGFKTFYQWNHAEAIVFLEQSGYEILEQKLLPGDPIPEGFYAAKPKETT